jgi:hypothetical protein
MGARSQSGMGTMGSSPAPTASAPAKREAAPSAEGAYERDDRYSAAGDEAESKNNLGTEYGEAHENHVQEVSFRRASATHPSQIIALRYDDERGLLARGIQLYEPPVVSYERPHPDPFPRNRFAPPPP